MCGICGIFNYQTNKPASQQLVQVMAASLEHRGPDDKGFHFDGPLGLGMRRLSIIDLTCGTQPISNETGTVWVVHNGEIYNFRELRQKLEAQGHLFRTRSDTESIVHSYEDDGINCVNHFNGIFAFALWDAPARRLLLTRDHFGVKPLYYCDCAGTLIFGSELRAILTHPSVKRELNPQGLDQFLSYGFTPSPRTMLKGIYKLPPGHRILCDPNGITIERYWTRIPSQVKGTEEDFIEALRLKAEEAIKRQMVSDVPIGVLLSGGVDSSSIVAVASEFAQERLQTFTVGVGSSGDVTELKEAQRVAERFKTQHYDVRVSLQEYLDYLPLSIHHLEEPIAVPSTLAMYFVSRLASQHVKVVLTGQGTDEPLAGYKRHLGVKYSRLYRHLPARFRRDIIARLLQGIPRQEGLKRAVNSLGIEETVQRFHNVYALFSEEAKQHLYQDSIGKQASAFNSEEAIRYWQTDVQHMDELAQMLYVDTRFSLSDGLLLLGDKLSMASSLEARVPYLDLEFMATVESIPSSWKVRGFTTKYIWKKAATKWLSPEIVYRRKVGFATPIDRWLRTELPNYLKNALLASNSACSLYFDSQSIRQLIKEHMTGQQDHHRRLFALWSFEHWHREFLEAKQNEKKYM